jgi:hypothetical protein
LQSSTLSYRCLIPPTFVDGRFLAWWIMMYHIFGDRDTCLIYTRPWMALVVTYIAVTLLAHYCGGSRNIHAYCLFRDIQGTPQYEHRPCSENGYCSPKNFQLHKFLRLVLPKRQRVCDCVEEANSEMHFIPPNDIAYSELPWTVFRRK